MWHSGKDSTCQCKRCRRRRFDLQVRRIPWSRKWQPTPVSLTGKSHGLEETGGLYSPWSCEESNMTEHLQQYNNQLHNLFWITDEKVIFSNSYYKVSIILISKSDKNNRERERGRKEGKKEGRRDPGLSQVGLANETSCRTEI